MSRPALPSLPSVEAVDALPPAALPALVLELAALQARAAARLVHVTGTQSSAAAAAPETRVATSETLGVKAAATVLGVSATALRRLEAAGVIASVRIGRRVLFRRETLVRFAADHEHARHERI